MNAVQLVAGAECVANGRVYQIDRVESPSKVLVRDKASGEFASLRVSQLAPVPGRTRANRSDLLHMSDKDWNRASLLASRFDKLDMARAPLTRLQRIATEAGLSLRHVQRLRKLYLRDPSVSLLAPGGSGPTERKGRLAPEVCEVIQKVIQEHYLTRERPPMSEIVRRVKSACRNGELPEPSRNAIEHRIRRLDANERDRARLGAKAANQRHQPRPGTLGVLRPLEIVEIDHTRVDVMVVSDDRLEVLGRPWISLAIDVGTRCVMGMYLSMDAPSAESVCLCIDHMVLPKHENDAADCEDLWPMYGKPALIHVDNGKDFRSKALSRGCREHRIDLTWRPVGKPHYGAHIERLNGTLMRHCHLLPGTTFSNTQQKGDYDSEARAKYTLEELRTYLVQRICRFYHAETHRDLGVPPLVAWERGWTNAEGVLTLPPVMADPLDFRMHFLPFETRKISRTGINFFRSRFWSEDLRPLVGRKEHEVHYDRRMPACVWVRALDGRVLEIPAVAGAAAGHRVHTPIDAETQARMNQRIDKGYEVTDELKAKVDKEARRARRHACKPVPEPAAVRQERASKEAEQSAQIELALEAAKPLESIRL
jgi:putative transposase